MRTHLCYMCERQCEGFSYSTFDLGAKPPLTPCGNIFERVTRRISVQRRCGNTRQQVRSLKKSTSIMLEVCCCLEHRSRQAVVPARKDKETLSRYVDSVKLVRENFAGSNIWSWIHIAPNRDTTALFKYGQYTER